MSDDPENKWEAIGRTVVLVVALLCLTTCGVAGILYPHGVPKQEAKP